MSKKTFIIVLVSVIAVTVLVTASALIYNAFFKDNLKKEEASKIIQSELDKTKTDAEKISAEALKLAKDAGVLGTYSATYNEISENTDDTSYMYTPTDVIKSTMTLNEDLTVSFDDGGSGWWSAAKDKNGFINISMGVQGESEPRIYLFCDDILIDITKAVFWGEVPQSDTFDKEFSSGPLKMTFRNDGKVEALYSEIIEEDGNEIPWNEAYSGQYRRDGNYLDISLNQSVARYLVFKASSSETGNTIEGFASRYYIRN